MNKLLTLIFIGFSIVCSGQNKKELIASAKKAIEENPDIISVEIAGQSAKEHRTIPLSLGEQLTIKNHKEYIKQMAPYVKQFFKRDSVNQVFLNNTISPYLSVGDTVETYSITDKEILLILKPKKTKN